MKTILFLLNFYFASSIVCFSQNVIAKNYEKNSISEIGEMFISTSTIRENCKRKIKMMTTQGYQTDGLDNKLAV